MRNPSVRQRIERIGLAFGIILAIVIIAAVLNWVLQSDQGPLEPGPEPTSLPTMGPTLTPATATPTATFDSIPSPKPGSLQHMLGYAPNRLADESLPLSDIAQYADIQRWMTARGVPVPTDPNDLSWDAWHVELRSLAIPEVFATRGTDDVWIDTYGFGLHQVHQVLAVGSAPDFVMVMRGDFDAEVLNTAWAESGYQAVRVNGVTYWSLNPGGSVDLSAPASRPALGNMNNVVLLDDGTLIATARSSRLEQTIRTIQDANPSLAGNPDIQALLAQGTDPDSFVTAVLLKGSVLEPLVTTATTEPASTPVTVTPEAELLIAGLQLAGDDPESTRMVLVTSYDSPDVATAAYARASRELATGTSGVTSLPYRLRAQPVSMRVLATTDGSLLVMHLIPVMGATDWQQIIEQRDLGYLMWPPGS
jgi:hypothetical protein